MIELQNTISAAEAFIRQCRATEINPAAVSPQFTNILRASRQEAGELPFRELGKKIASKHSLATVTRAFRADRATLPKWRLVQDILVDGLEVGPETVNMMRKAWAAAQNVIKPVGLGGSVDEATVPHLTITSHGTECDICGLEVGNREKHNQFHADYIRREPTKLAVVR